MMASEILLNSVPEFFSLEENHIREHVILSGNRVLLPAPRPLGTVRETFTSYSSSFSKSLCRNQ